LVPLATRDDLIRQIPGLKRVHSSYVEYAQVSRPEDLFSPTELEDARKLPAYEFRSGVYFQKEDGSFEFEPFPAEAQWSPIYALEVNKNTGSIYLGGSSSDFRVDLGKSVNIGVLSYEWKQGLWQNPENIGNSIRIPFAAEIRNLKLLRTGTGFSVLGAPNNGPLIWVK